MHSAAGGQSGVANAGAGIAQGANYTVQNLA